MLEYTVTAILNWQNMNSMIYMIQDECDIAIMVNMIVLMWYVLLCMLLWFCEIYVCGHDMSKLHDR